MNKALLIFFLLVQSCLGDLFKSYNPNNSNHLAYNQNIIPSDLAGEGKLITYNGNQLDATSQARYAEGFYDRIFDISAINTDSNRRDSQLAGTLAHEGGHRMFNNNGQSYTKSEENASHMIGDYVQGRWNVYQGDNSTLRNSITSISSLNSSFSSSLINLDNNFYANNVKFGNDVNPLLVNELMENSKITSPYQTGRIHPTLGTVKDHKGTDTVAMGEDKSIYAAGDGVVKEVRFQEKIKTNKDGNPILNKSGNVLKSGWGNTVLIEHSNENGVPTYRTRYSHMQTLPNLTIDQKIKEGQAFGTMGASGGVSGPHLHYELQKYDPQTNSWKYINPESVNVGKYEKLIEVPK